MVKLFWVAQNVEVYVNEADQITQARQGSATAWASLVSQQQDALFRLAYLLVGDADEAEDVVQEALIRAFYALDRFDPTRPLRPWLFQIVRNLARNRRRSVRRYLAAVGRWWQSTAQRETAPTPTGPTGAIEEEEAQVLWQAVQQLATSDQEVIYLRYFLELSVADTAAALKVAEGTVKSRLSRALVRLRRVVEREFPGLQREGAV
jgi:RNA polymerase sigma-70 factor, ECF subfamily